MDMVESQGKQNKRIHILLTEDMTTAIDALITYRRTSGIADENRFIFANQGKGHVNAWQVMQDLAIKAGCEAPKRITATRLRKYVATVTQVISLFLMTMKSTVLMPVICEVFDDSLHLNNEIKMYIVLYFCRSSTSTKRSCPGYPHISATHCKQTRHFTGNRRQR